MRKAILVAVIAMLPVAALAQNPKGATYITAEEVALVNKSPGVDRQIVNVDIGKSNLAVGVIHRGRTGAPPARVPPVQRLQRVRGAPPPAPCGEKAAFNAARHGVRHRARRPDRNLHHHFRRRHAGHGRTDRQRPPLRA